MKNRETDIETAVPHREVQSAESLSLILETVERLHRTTELQDLLTESLEAVCVVMRSEASSLMLLDEQTGKLQVSLPTGPVRDKIRGRTIPAGKGIGGWVVKNRRPFLSNSPAETEEFWGELSSDFRTENILCVPLLDGSKPIGVLQAVNHREGAFSEDDIPAFNILAMHVARAILRSRQIELLKGDLREKELLIREAHHRIKNNLASISALIELELPEAGEESSQQVLRNTLSRLQSVTELHDMVSSTGDLHQVDLGAYLDSLSQKILELLSDTISGIKVHISTESIFISSEKAVYCGMILSELLVNVYKHAFDGVEGGEVQVTLNRLPDRTIQLKVTDNGSGLPEDFDVEAMGDRGSVGVWVIDVLRRKLDASLRIENDNGTCVTFSFGGPGRG